MTKSHFTPQHPRSSNTPLPTHNPKQPNSILSLLHSHPIIKKHDIRLEIPENRLIPMINNRMTYLQWVRDLLEVRMGRDEVKRREANGLMMREDRNRKDQGNLDDEENGDTEHPLHESHESSQEHDANNHDANTSCNDVIHGIDIGTGSSAIYALLGNKEFGWHFTATECDSTSYESACQNAYERNDVQREEIDIKLVDRDASLLKFIGSSDNSTSSTPRQYHFTVCNPPFFESEKHAQRSQNPLKVCPGSASELWCVGGEYQFLARLVDESLRLRDRVSLYTSWVGRKSTLKRLKQHLYAKRVFTQYHTEFLEGLQYRWGIAWVVPADHSTALSPHVVLPHEQLPHSSTTRHFAVKRRMRHSIQCSLKDSHALVRDEIHKLEQESLIQSVQQDKYTGVFTFTIPLQRENITVHCHFNSVSQTHTVLQLECADFQDQAYQQVYTRICEAITK